MQKHCNYISEGEEIKNCFPFYMRTYGVHANMKARRNKFTRKGERREFMRGAINSYHYVANLNRNNLAKKDKKINFSLSYRMKISTHGFNEFVILSHNAWGHMKIFLKFLL